MTFELDSFIPYRLAVAATEISRRFAKLYAAEAGLSIPEWRVMAHLAHSGPVSVREITQRVALDKSVVSRAATRLQHAGLISKQDHGTDRRLVALALTPKGQALMARLARIAEAYQNDLRLALGPDAESFERGLDLLIGQH